MRVESPNKAIPAARDGHSSNEPLRIATIPEPKRLSRMLGPSVLLLAVGLGSGEFILFPSITTSIGFGFLWAAWVGVLTQYFVNMEITRYAMATGETITTGLARLHPAWPWLILFANIVCWMWPGWATGTSQCLIFLFGGDHLTYSIGTLLVCGLLLTLGPVVYKTARVVQTALIVFSITFLLVLTVGLVHLPTLGPLAKGLAAVGSVPSSIDIPLLATALAFAGAGGTLNLCQSNYVREAKYAMGAFAPELRSPLTGQAEAISSFGSTFRTTPEAMRSWRVWWRRASIEHFLTFAVLGILTIVLLSLISYEAIGMSSQRSGFDFVAAIADSIGLKLGAWARGAYLLMGAAVLFTTAFGILDATSRISASIVKLHWRWCREQQWLSESKLFATFLWLEIGLSLAVLSGGLDQPLLLLTISGSLNLLVMAIYSALLLYLNRGGILMNAVGLRGLRFVAVLWAAGFYGFFALYAIFHLM